MTSQLPDDAITAAFDAWFAEHFPDVTDDETQFDRGEIWDAWNAGRAEERERIELALLGCVKCGEIHRGRYRKRGHQARCRALFAPDINTGKLADLLGGTADGAHTPGGAT